MKNISFQNKIVITIILFVLFYVLFALYSDVNKIMESFQQIQLKYLLPILGIFIFTAFLRGLLQCFLLNSMGIRLSIKKSFLLFLAGLSMLVTPGGSGQVIKSHFIQKKYGYPFSKSLPLVFGERFCDFLAITTILTFTAFSLYSLSSLLIIIISSTLLIAIFLSIKNKRFFNIFQSIISKIPFLNKMIPQTTEMYESLQGLFKPRVIIVAWSSAVLIFLVEGLVIYLSFLAFNIDLGYIPTFQIYYSSLLYGTLSLVPSGMGILEGVFAKLLIQKHYELALITSLILFIRLITLWFATGLGFIMTYLVMFDKNSNQTK